MRNGAPDGDDPLVVGDHWDRQYTSVAKNVILFIGDGMGMTTVTAARIMRGQELGLSGEEHLLSIDTFNNIALSKVI